MDGGAVGEEELREIGAEIEGGFVAAGAGAGLHRVVVSGSVW